jgi:hypothetical protein
MKTAPKMSSQPLRTASHHGFFERQAVDYFKRRAVNISEQQVIAILERVDSDIPRRRMKRPLPPTSHQRLRHLLNLSDKGEDITKRGTTSPLKRRMLEHYSATNVICAHGGILGQLQRPRMPS